MVNVADDYLLAAHFDGNDSLSGDGDLGVVGKGDVLVVHLLVGDEGLVGVPEVVFGTAVEDGDVQPVSDG